MKINLNDVQGAKECLPKNNPLRSLEMTYFNKAVNQTNACQIWLDEEELAKKLWELVKKTNGWRSNLDDLPDTNPDKSIIINYAKSICANAQKIIRMGKGE